MAFVCFSIIVSNLSAQNPDAVLEKANDLYQSDQFQEALNLFESIEKEGLFSKALFYNMGNTFYRLGDNGKAVLYYERALVLAPNDPQIQQDLAFLKTQLSDEIIALDVFPLIRFWQNLKHSLSSNLWTLLGMLFFWGGTAGLIFWILGASRKQKKIGFFGGIAALLLCTIPFILALSSKQDNIQPEKAVILSSTTALKSAPAAGSETLFNLFEGASVTTLDQVKEWTKVSLANGYQGWVNEEDLALVAF